MDQKINGLSLELISHPSETIVEMMISLNITSIEIKNALNIDYKELMLFLKGKTLLKKEHFAPLSRLFNIKESFIEKIFATYLINISKVLKLNGISTFEYEIINQFELRKFRKYLANYSLINNMNLIKKVEWLRQYFNVKSLDIFKTISSSNVAFRASKKSNECLLESLVLISTLIKNENTPVQIQGNIGKTLFDELKEITFIKEFDEVIIRIKSILYRHGINFIYYEYDANFQVQGFLSRTKNEVYLGVSNKGKYQDIFWFTLFHELGHLLCNILTSEYVVLDDEEKIADSLAQDYLINRKEYDLFLSKKNFTENSILEFSENNNIAPGIIVGRLQKDNIVGYEKYNYLRKKV